MSKRDYYEVLDLVPSCTITDVKKNYHKLALIWHPDKHIDKCEAENKFTEIHEAYSVLGDANKRKIYDTKGHKGLSQDEEDLTTCHVKNFFCQKGFNGTDKSAFDVLRDIFEESDEDDDFFKSCMFKCPDGFKSNLESFFDENKFLSENEDSVSFCKGYTPTFMDADFFEPSCPLFSAAFPEDSCTSQTELFSFFTSVNSEMQGFSRKSATAGNKKKSKKCPKQQQAEKCQKSKKGYSQKNLDAEEIITFNCTLQNNTLNCKRSSTFECEQFFEALFSQDDDDFFDAEMQELEKNIFFACDKTRKEKKSFTMKPQDQQPELNKSRKKMRSHTNI